MLHKSFFDTVVLLCHIASYSAVVFPAVLTVSTRYFIGRNRIWGFCLWPFFSSVSPFLYLSRRFWLFFLSHEHLVLCSGCVYMGGRGNLVNGTTPPLVVNEIKGKKFGTCSSPPRRLMTVGNARCRFHPVVTSSDMRNIKAKHKRHTHTISNFDRFLQWILIRLCRAYIRSYKEKGSRHLRSASLSFG
jgi:hypothetical protein